MKAAMIKQLDDVLAAHASLDNGVIWTRADVIRQAINRGLTSLSAAVANGQVRTIPDVRRRGEKRTQAKLNETAQQVYEFIKSNPGLRTEIIGKNIGYSTAELTLPMKKLVTEKRIYSMGQKRGAKYFVGEKPSKVTVKKARGTTGR